MHAQACLEATAGPMLHGLTIIDVYPQLSTSGQQCTEWHSLPVLFGPARVYGGVAARRRWSNGVVRCRSFSTSVVQRCTTGCTAGRTNSVPRVYSREDQQCTEWYRAWRTNSVRGGTGQEYTTCSCTLGYACLVYLYIRLRLSGIPLY